MALARRLAVALAALVGLALTVLGAWFAVVLGPQGNATFTATSREPAVLLGPNVLNRVNVPATVTARADSGAVFLGAATPRDAADAVGQARHEVAIAASFPARTLQLEGFVGEPLADPSAFHVWRATGEGTLTLSQDEAPQAVLAYASNGGPVEVSVAYARSTWFLQALVALVVGLVLLGFAGAWLWQHVRPSVDRGPSGPAAAARTGSGAHSVDPASREEEAR